MPVSLKLPRFWSIRPMDGYGIGQEARRPQTGPAHVQPYCLVWEQLLRAGSYRPIAKFMA